MKKAPVKAKKKPPVKQSAKARKPRKKVDSKLPVGVDADGVYRVKVPKSALEDFFGRTPAQVKADTKKAKKAQGAMSLGPFPEGGSVFRGGSVGSPIAPDPDTQRMIDAMLAQSNRDTEAQLAHVESLKGPRSGVNEAEVYSYTSFPAPIHDYLDYIKSTKNNLSSWSDLKEFIKTTEGFWKTMRDQSCKIALKFAKEQYDGSFYITRGDEDVSSNKYHDKGYFRRILWLYMDELKREMSYTGSRLLGDMLSLISDYGEHENKVAERVEESILERSNDE